MYQKRVVERKENNQWVRIDFMDLKKGDTFRLFDTPEMVLVEFEGKSEWIANCDAYVKDDIGTIDVDV